MAPLQKVPLGASCILPDESSPDFPGYNTTEINTQDHDAQCASGFCIGVNFRGRATCTYGQPPDPANPAVADPAKRTCRTPGTNQVVTVPVEPQLVSRPPDVAVYCSCRCDGPDGTGPFCACPSGFECTNLVPDIGSHAELAGSYCLKAGTAVHAPTLLDAGPSCSLAELNCGPPP
jgi:hypothetical protein